MYPPISMIKTVLVVICSVLQRFKSLDIDRGLYFPMIICCSMDAYYISNISNLDCLKRTFGILYRTNDDAEGTRGNDKDNESIESKPIVVGDQVCIGFDSVLLRENNY